MRALALLLALVLALPAVGAQVAVPTLPIVGDPSQPYPTAVHAGEFVTGTNLTREDVRIALDLDFRSLDFDAIGVVFGGGDFRAQGRLTAHLEFRAINVSHLEGALPRQGIPAGPAGQTVITAGEFRDTLSAAAVAAFETQEQALLTSFVATTFPDATVLSSRFAWSNVSPQDTPTPGAPRVPSSPQTVQSPVPDSREPPVTLDTTLDVQYLKRESLVDLVEQLLDRQHLSPAERAKKDARDRMLADIRGQSAGALYERSAFDLLGITQLIVIEMPPGWDLGLTLHLPKGYTYEYASPDVTVDGGHGSATTVALADSSLVPVKDPVAVSLSNRYLVAVTMVAAVLLCGAALRFPVMLVANRVGRRRRETSDVQRGT
ncbi:MAG: hypothetical protein QOE90_2579 [Thermoplasmata archaeon]|jgi:hypothetical protein|nr:hypothetical protein [Thermoplasmata archaeon]